MKEGVQQPSGLPWMSRRGLLLGASAGFLAGCGLPTERPVKAGIPVGSGGSGEVTVLPPGPVAGATPSEIVRGFLRAGSASNGDSSVATQFLSPSMAQRWQPDADTSVVKSLDDLDLASPSSGHVTMKAIVLARLDNDGRYQINPQPLAVTTSWGLTQIAGEWRISEMPKRFGRCLGQAQAARLFRPFTVYWLANNGTTLVPDPRWFSADRLATRVAAAQLGGVPPYLASAVAPSRPVVLNTGSVVISNGVATVDLDLGGPIPAADIRQIYGQLTGSMTQIPDVRAVQVTVRGVPLDASGANSPVYSVNELGMSTPATTRDAPVLLHEGQQWKRMGANGLLGFSGDSANFDGSQMAGRAVALSLDGMAMAAVPADRSRLMIQRQGSQIYRRAIPARELTRPAFDRSGQVWLAGRGTGEQQGVKLWVLGTANDSELRAVPGPWFVPSIDIVGIRPSPEGARLALITRPRGGGPASLMVTGIQRGRDGQVTSLSAEGMLVAGNLIQLADLCWVSPTSLAVIGRGEGAKALSVYLVDIGGGVTLLSPLANPTQVTTVDGQRSVVVRDKQGRYFQRAGSGWVVVPDVNQVVVGGL